MRGAAAALALVLLAPLAVASGGAGGDAETQPQVGECQMWMPVGSRPVVGRWFEVSCAFGDERAQTVQGALFPALYDAAGLDDRSRYRSAAVEALWLSPYGFEVPRQRMGVVPFDCAPDACPQSWAAGLGGARIELGPDDLAQLGPEPVVWIGPEATAQLDPALTWQVIFLVRISLFEQDVVPRGYSAFD